MALAAPACKNKASTSNAAPASGSSVAGGDQAGTDAIDPQVAALPGELWFFAEEPSPHRLVRITAGKRFEIVGQLEPSSSKLPDGRLVAIESAHANGLGPMQLVLIGGDGMLTRIGPTAPQIHDPVIGPDGSWLIFSMFVDDDHVEIYRIDVATGKLTQLTKATEYNASPTSLGGDAITFSSYGHGLFRGSANGGRATPVIAPHSSHSSDSVPTPSPDRKTIAFASSREGMTKIFLIDPDGTHLRRLTAWPDRNGDESKATWSPDGAQIAYVNHLGDVRQVWIRELASGKDHLITPLGFGDDHPTWSPDGSWLLVARSSEGHPLVGDLWAIRTADRTAVQITHTPEIEFNPRWL